MHSHLNFLKMSFFLLFRFQLFLYFFIIEKDGHPEFYDIKLQLSRSNNSLDQEWWIVSQKIEKDQKDADKTATSKFEGLELYVFSDQVSPPSLGFLAGYGYVICDIVFFYMNKSVLLKCYYSRWACGLVTET